MPKRQPHTKASASRRAKPPLPRLGRGLEALGSAKVLPAKEVLALVWEYRRTRDQAVLSRIIASQLGWVHHLAFKFGKASNVPHEDLVQEGLIGLMKAIDRFKRGKGANLTSYASWWIRHFIMRTVANENTTVRLPVHRQDKARKLAKTRKRLRDALGREPTDEEMAESAGLTLKKLHGFYSDARHIVSLDEPLSLANVSDDLQWELVDPAPGPMTLVEECEEENRAKAWIAITMKELDKRERAVIRTRYLNGDLTLEQCAQFIGRVSKGGKWGTGKDKEAVPVSRERVRQIEAGALKKLRRGLLAS
jgi:RNA polymerase primary sigma factor